MRHSKSNLDELVGDEREEKRRMSRQEDGSSEDALGLVLVTRRLHCVQRASRKEGQCWLCKGFRQTEENKISVKAKVKVTLPTDCLWLQAVHAAIRKYNSSTTHPRNFSLYTR